MSNFSVSEPSCLALLLLLLPVVWLGLHIRSLGTPRRLTATLLRSAAIVAIVLALAGLHWVKQQEKLAVFFLLDHSASIPEDVQKTAQQWVRNFVDTSMTDDDAAGVIVFGADASVELGIADTLGLREVRSLVNTAQTDIAGAVRLAMAAFPQGYMRRIVLFSDGQETRDSILEEAKIARAEGIGFDVVPLYKRPRNEVRLVEVSTPVQTNTKEPFQVRVVVHSEQDGSGTLQMYQRTANERRALAPQQIQLQKGDNVFLLTQKIDDAGFYQFEAVVESMQDTFVQNNTAYSFTAIRGEPRVLLAHGPQLPRHLLDALTEEGLEVETIGAPELPASLPGLQNFDAIALADVSAIDLSPRQLSALEAAVRDQGIGLVMIGGPDSFGAGGYLNTPVERALPVSMDIKQRKVLPRGALAVILHTCEMPDGNAWARDIALAALETLASQDLMGGLGYTWDGADDWLFTLQPVGDKSALKSAITSAASTIGDMPAVEPTLIMAHRALAEADAAVKRIVIISDGDPASPTSATIDGLVEAKISVSTVCIAPHSANDQNMLQWLADSTGGNYYFVMDPNRLPQIFSKEASIVRRGVLIEKEFYPQLQHQSEIMLGLTAEPMPSLLGYVVTTAKDEATIPLVSDEGDPLLAHWRYGLGKSVAFTSDAAPRWAVNWLGWSNFRRFWSQGVRWSMRDLTPDNFRVETGISEGHGQIRIDAIDAEGGFINFLNPKAVVSRPDHERLEMEFAQTAPGVYEAQFPVDDPGVYMASVLYSRPDGSTGLLPAGLSLNYSPEFSRLGTNAALLENIVATSGGVLLNDTGNPFRHDLPPAQSRTPLWPWLIAAAACLLPLEVFVRRVMLPWSLWWNALLRHLRRLPGLRSLLPPLRQQAAPVTGHYFAAATAPADETREEFEHAAFGEVTAADASRPRAATAAPEPKIEARRPGKTEYTSALLLAKERAQKRQKSADAEKKEGD